MSYTGHAVKLIGKTTLLGSYDVAVIGGGIVGLATARQLLLKHPTLKVCVLERETQLATQQSARNSGVIHSGIYYKKGSLKSRFCVRGARLAREYCLEKGLPYKKCGKLVIATTQDEVKRLHKLFDSAKANEIEDIELVGPSQIQKIQPGCTNALEAIWSPNTAITDWRQVSLSYANDFTQAGGTMHLGFVATHFDMGTAQSVKIIDRVSKTAIETHAAVNAAGIFSDEMARRTGWTEFFRMVPFEGHYYQLSENLAKMVRTNIYPTPDPKLPFLGVHVTPRVDGSVILGPTAVLRLNYGFTHPKHTYEILFKSGVMNFLKNAHNFSAGLSEIFRLMSRKKFASDVSQLLPGVTEADLVDKDFSGIRAQLVDKNGTLVDDFLFETGHYQEFRRVLNLINLPSPAATSSLAISERVLDIVENRMLPGAVPAVGIV